MWVAVINPCVVPLAGHFLWLQAVPGVPPYLVPDSAGRVDSPALSGFYMFFTMIILLQVLCEKKDVSPGYTRCWLLFPLNIYILNPSLSCHLIFYFHPSLLSLFVVFSAGADSDLPVCVHRAGEDRPNLLHH